MDLTFIFAGAMMRAAAWAAPTMPMVLSMPSSLCVGREGGYKRVRSGEDARFFLCPPGLKEKTQGALPLHMSPLMHIGHPKMAYVVKNIVFTYRKGAGDLADLHFWLRCE
jgi:hypothetical protein